MRILVPVLDSVNALPAARYIVREFMGRERPEVHVLYVGSRLALALRLRLAEKSVAATRELLQWHGIRHTVELLAGNRAKALQIVDRLEDRRRRERVSPMTFVVAWLGLAEYDKALDALEDAMRQHDVSLFSVSSLVPDAIWNPVRSNPRFIAVLREMNLLEYAAKR